MTQNDRKDKVTIKIPRPLYNRIQELIDESGFNSVTDFVVYVLRDLVSIKRSQDELLETLTGEEISKIRQRLQNLGYL